MLQRVLYAAAGLTLLVTVSCRHASRVTVEIPVVCITAPVQLLDCDSEGKNCKRSNITYKKGCALLKVK